MPLPPLLERLLTTPGPSGQERAAAAVWREAAAPVGEVSSDVLGSSWVRVPGTAGGPSLALVGHIDEIAVVVTNLGDDGLAAVRPGSGWNPVMMVGQRVDVLTRNGPVPGVVAAKEPKRRRGADRKPVEADDLFLDVGAKDGEELRSLIRPGDNVVWHGAPLSLQGNRVVSRAFDNRMGCYVALEAARRIAEDGGAPGDVIAVAAVQEEVGDFAGSRTAAFSIQPDVAVAIDVTHTTDVRGADRRRRGQGSPRRRPDDLARPVDPRGRLRAAVRSGREGGHPDRGRGLGARLYLDRRRRRLSSAAAACRRASSPSRSATCIRRSRCSTSTISSARCSSSSRSRAASSLA